MQIVWIARLFSIVIFIILSTGFHYIVFSKSGGYINSIFKYPYMFIIYFLFALLSGEHFLNFIKRKYKNDKDNKSNFK